jgi:two-component system, response regulator YesN
MINAILADDEPIIIKGLRKLIPWAEHGIQIVGEAWTGKGLMELIEREMPQLVITDISMPDGSGIDVIKEIGRRQLGIKVIFISAYQEFSYAKDALAFGAVDYLVKPVEKELLLAAVERAVSELREEKEELTSKSKLAAYEHKDKKSRLEDLFDRLIDGDIRVEEAVRRLKELEAGYSHEMYTVLMVLPEQPEKDERWGEHERRLLYFAVSNMAEELIHQQAEGLIIRRSDRLCAVINHPDSYQAASLAEELVHTVRQYLKVELAVGIGQTAMGLGGIKASYRSSEGALSKCIFAGGGKPVMWLDSSEASSGMEKELANGRQAVLYALMAKDQHKLAEELEGLLVLTAEASGWNKEQASTSCYASLVEWAEGLKELGITDSWKEQQNWLPVLQGFRRYEDMKGFVRLQAAAMLRFIEEAGKGKEAQQLQSVKDFIDKHYMENITLESCSSMMFINPYYFSSLFKKHTNMNFKQYLTEVRMKQAVKLLLQTDLMVYEIAERVGYNNARQFSDMFKKQFGKLPQDYKNQR